MNEPQGFYDRLARSLVGCAIGFFIWLIILLTLTYISPYR
jgi:hypothetical protein